MLFDRNFVICMLWYICRSHCFHWIKRASQHCLSPDPVKLFESYFIKNNFSSINKVGDLSLLNDISILRANIFTRWTCQSYLNTVCETSPFEFLQWKNTDNYDRPWIPDQMKNPTPKKKAQKTEVVSLKGIYLKHNRRLLTGHAHTVVHFMKDLNNSSTSCLLWLTFFHTRSRVPVPY